MSSLAADLERRYHRGVPPNPSGPPASAPIPYLVQILICRNCGQIVVFGAGGWRHRDADRPCPALVVAWPPPTERDDD
jgi:hypothetical protein